MFAVHNYTSPTILCSSSSTGAQDILTKMQYNANVDDDLDQHCYEIHSSGTTQMKECGPCEETVSYYRLKWYTGVLVVSA
jgi:hypothetical protein